MAENYLSKLKIGNEVYNLKDAKAQAALALLGTAAQKNYESTLTDGENLPTGAAVKSYVDAHKASVTDAAATIQVNNTTATTLATVDGTNITAKASFCWEEYE